MGLNAAAFALSKKYTADTADTLGSLVGAPCTIKSITTDADKNKIVEFEWTGTSGTTQQQTMTIPAGVSVTGYTKVDDTHFKWNYSDGTFSEDIEYPKEQIMISQETGNALTEKFDGLYVSSTGVEISQEPNNALESKSDGLYVKETSDIEISQDPDNQITQETDGIKVGHDNTKFDVDQGIANAGKALVVGSDGNVTTGDAGVKVSTKEGNSIETVTEEGKEGIFVPEGLKVSEKSGNIIQNLTTEGEEGIYAAQGTELSYLSDQDVRDIFEMEVI